MSRIMFAEDLFGLQQQSLSLCKGCPTMSMVSRLAALLYHFLGPYASPSKLMLLDRLALVQPLLSITIWTTSMDPLEVRFLHTQYHHIGNYIGFPGTHNW